MSNETQPKPSTSLNGDSQNDGTDIESRRNSPLNPNNETKSAVEQDTSDKNNKGTGAKGTTTSTTAISTTVQNDTNTNESSSVTLSPPHTRITGAVRQSASVPLTATNASSSSMKSSSSSTTTSNTIPSISKPQQPISLTKSKTIAPVKLGTTTVIGVAVPTKTTVMNGATAVTTKPTTKTKALIIPAPVSTLPQSITATGTTGKASMTNGKVQLSAVAVDSKKIAAAATNIHNDATTNGTNNTAIQRLDENQQTNKNIVISERNGSLSEQNKSASQVAVSQTQTLKSNMNQSSSSTITSAKALHINNDNRSSSTTIQNTNATNGGTNTKQIHQGSVGVASSSLSSTTNTQSNALPKPNTEPSTLKKNGYNVDDNQSSQPQKQKPIPQPQPIPTNLIPQPFLNDDMKQIISDILMLLQTYGALSARQIEYNLPPYPTLDNPTLSTIPTLETFTSPPTTSSSESLPSSSVEYRFKIIQDVLDVLSVLQVIHKTDIAKAESSSSTSLTSSKSLSLSKPESNKSVKTENLNGDGMNKSSEESKTQESKENSQTGENDTKVNQPKPQPEQNEEKIVYFFNNGKVRGDVIYPWEIMDMIQDANKEINESIDRIQMLKKELGIVGGDLDKNVSIPKKEVTPVRSGRKRKIDKIAAAAASIEPPTFTPIVASSIPPSQRIKTTREFLKVMLHKYPDIVYDPVYNAALRNFNVDLGAVARERERFHNQAQTGSVRRGSSASKQNAEYGRKVGSGQSSSSKRRQSSSGQGGSSQKKKRVKKKTEAPSPIPMKMNGDHSKVAAKQQNSIQVQTADKKIASATLSSTAVTTSQHQTQRIATTINPTITSTKSSGKAASVAISKDITGAVIPKTDVTAKLDMTSKSVQTQQKKESKPSENTETKPQDSNISGKPKQDKN